MRDLVLVNPPSPFLDFPRAMLPLGLLYVGAEARKAGIDVAICDLSLGVNSETLPPANIYGLTATTPQIGSIRHIVLKCRAANPRATIIMGGPHVTAQSAMESQDQFGIDAVVSGEAEGWFGKTASDIVLFGTRPNIRLTGAPVDSLDTIPFPAWDLLPMRHYGQSLEGYWTATVLGARGCPGKCAFCSKSIFGNHYRRRSIDNILSEVETLKARYQYRAIHFLDDALIVKPKDLIALCLGMKKLDMKWKCLMRTDTVVDRLGKTAIELMSECGCLEIAYGVESGSQKVLDLINKGTTVEKNTKAVQWTEAAGIKSKAFLVVGMPGESRETIAATKAWFEEARPSNYSLAALRPFRGSPIADNPERFGIKIVDSDPLHYSYRGKNELTSVVETEHLKAEELSRLGNALDKYFRRLVSSR